jgi:pimeloyl-ACP methyl ester carboxylesterase
MVTLAVRIPGKRHASGERHVTVESWGAPTGTPVFLLHGTPGSRSGPRPRASVLYRLGIRLISYDRPGYGDSSRLPGRKVADAAGDVGAIADHLGIDRFGVVGRSGGGPHALACAALLGDRVLGTAVLVGLAPSDADAHEWYDGMTGSNVTEYSTADGDHEAFTAMIESRAREIRNDPETLLQFLNPELQDPDRRVVGDAAIRRLLTETYAEALKHGADGWIDDVLAFRSPWGFEVAKVTTPVFLWHGADDMFSPVRHTHWLARQIPRSSVEVGVGAAHFGAVEMLPRALAWIKEADESDRSEGMWIQGPHQPAFSM